MTTATIASNTTPFTFKSARSSAVERESPSTASSVMFELTVPGWRKDLHQEAVRLLATRPVDMDAFATAYKWITTLPAAVPAPSLGFGDDLSVSVEWDRGGNTLHVRFEGGTAEMYFAPCTGPEVEADFDGGGDALAQALRTIARAG